jgi:5-methylcytosine-specific restriction endonuclease McrBC regulatory subunit McrC
VQLQERRAGNTAYQQQQYSTALHHYQRALAVVTFVVGQSSHDQAEVDYNKATVLLNMAAVHMALKVSPVLHIAHATQRPGWSLDSILSYL